MFSPGDPVPTIYARSLKNPRYSLDSVAGRHVALCFIGSATAPGIASLLDNLYRSSLFDDGQASLFIISHDPQDESEGRLTERYPGIRIFWDHDRVLAEQFGCMKTENGEFTPATFLLDPGLRMLSVMLMTDPATHYDRVADLLSGFLARWQDEGFAPVLTVPHLLEPDLCNIYIDYCRKRGLNDSGSMNTDPVTGQTVLITDHSHKRRSDCLIEDPALRKALEQRISQRLIPQIKRAFQFDVTRLERYLIGCYDSETGGHFRPHKDNTTLGTAHRRFAVSIGLNADDYEGGDLRFPEFGMRSYRPPTGGAIVFSCSLLHEVLPVTAGKRYAILPFLYDETAAKIRQDNATHLDDPKLRAGATAG